MGAGWNEWSRGEWQKIEVEIQICDTRFWSAEEMGAMEMRGGGKARGALEIATVLCRGRIRYGVVRIRGAG